MAPRDNYHDYHATASPQPAAFPQPGTLLWIGTTSHPEMKDAFKFCSQIAAQLAVRRDAAEAVRRPAGFVRRILFARPTRHVPKPSMIDRLVATYSGADSIAICGQLCDGESRTGTPWPMGDRMRFSRWTERLPRWLEPCIGGTKPRRDPAQGSKVQSLLVIADRFDTAQPLLLWADSVGVFAAWHPRFVPALHGRFKTILWDDSAAMATSANHWQQRLSEACQNGKSPEHIWMSLQPSIDEIEQAKRGGISHVLTKPVMIDAILPITNRLA